MSDHHYTEAEFRAEIDRSRSEDQNETCGDVDGMGHHELIFFCDGPNTRTFVGDILSGQDVREVQAVIVHTDTQGNVTIDEYDSCPVVSRDWDNLLEAAATFYDGEEE